MTILSGIKIIEIEGIGPAPFCGMMLADLGADVVVVERRQRSATAELGDKAITKRGKRVIKLDLKSDEGREQLLELVGLADGLIEGMRPGVMERLGVGPSVCQKINPKLAYGRVTGWGQDGPLASAAGHDLNYIALSGALWYAGQPDQAPITPPTLVGDVAAGGLYMTIGMLAAILKARETGVGDVVDAAMVDGSAHMMNLLLSLQAVGGLKMERGQSLLDGPHWYDSYVCQDGGYITIGSMEPQFYNLLLNKLGLENDPSFAHQMDASQWPVQKARLATLFKTKTRDEWCALMEGSDICFAPVLNPEEATEHPHMSARGIYFKNNDQLQTAPAPRFSKHKSKPADTTAKQSQHRDIIHDWKMRE